MKDNIQNLESTLSVFAKILTQLNRDGNLVIGGSNALVLHGIKVARVPVDVDIIIYSPTDRQLKILELVSDFSHVQTVGGDYPKTVFKFKTKKLGKVYTLDILFEEGSLPENLLLFKKGNILARVQDVDKVIEAKSSYKRSKDLTDLLDFKNLNFNS